MISGEAQIVTFEGTIQHRFSDGALTLIKLIFEWAENEWLKHEED